MRAVTPETLSDDRVLLTPIESASLPDPLRAAMDNLSQPPGFGVSLAQVEKLLRAVCRDLSKSRRWHGDWKLLVVRPGGVRLMGERGIRHGLGWLLTERTSGEGVRYVDLAAWDWAEWPEAGK